MNESDDAKQKRMLNQFSQSLAARDVSRHATDGLAGWAVFIGNIKVLGGLSKWLQRTLVALLGVFALVEPVRIWVLAMLGMR
jgi:hypothetical protein